MQETQTSQATDSPHSCCTGSLVGANEDGSVVKVIPLFCHKWSCPRCRKYKAHHWRQIALAGDPDRFMTLTLRAAPEKDPRDLIAAIKYAFPKLVAKIRKTWGTFEYLSVFDLTKQDTPHLHVLQRGVFVDKFWLSRAWHELTGAFIVDIRKIRRQGDVANYITKYMGKSIAKVSRAMEGMRVIQTSKNWVLQKNLSSLEPEAQAIADVFNWTYCSCAPSEVTACAQKKLSSTIDPESSDTCLLLRGPPTTDPVEVLMYDLIWSRFL